MEDNKIIAKFMGYKIKEFKGKEYFQPTLEPYVYLTDGRDDVEELQNFKISWDWLMPVIEKIFTLQFDEVKGLKEYSNKSDNIFDGLDCGLHSSKEHIYTRVVEFIKWYNEDK